VTDRGWPSHRSAIAPSDVGTQDLIGTCEAFWNSVTDHDGPAPISFDRCIDWLLDLYQVTRDAQLRTLIAEVLDDLRDLGPVEGEFEDMVLGALASVEAACDVVAARQTRNG
jgi:hypothetical protein